MNKKRTSNADDSIRYGKVLLVNNFITERGFYTIRIVEYEKYVYFHKMLNGEVVEFKKIGKAVMYREEK